MFINYGENVWRTFLRFSRSKYSTTLSDCNGTRTHNHLVRKRTLNHLAKLDNIRHFKFLLLIFFSRVSFENKRPVGIHQKNMHYFGACYFSLTQPPGQGWVPRKVKNQREKQNLLKNGGNVLYFTFIIIFIIITFIL